mmetsp:Transcript_18577/g.26744  ORF Transcript_18577/g.26744 Transcript_18577/m.26744 type:complete len:124 (-) Transcript_18577:1997-2368(-)
MPSKKPRRLVPHITHHLRMLQRKGCLCLKVTFRIFLIPSHLGQKSVVGRESVEMKVVVGEDVVDEEVTMPEEGEEEKKEDEEECDTDRETVMAEVEDDEENQMGVDIATDEETTTFNEDEGTE